MEIPFHKYQGTGNDFVMIDNRDLSIPRDSVSLFAALCHRHLGVGADGVILLQEKEGFDFEMVYANADGRESTMCGNGGRCIVRFAEACGIVRERYHFLAVDGMHEAMAYPDAVSLKMQHTAFPVWDGEAWVLNTGSPHWVRFTDGVGQLDMKKEGAAVRYSDTYNKEGINVNFAEWLGDKLFMRTYERGVEDETLSCGTGVTAAALSLAAELHWPAGAHRISVDTPGGTLRVHFTLEDDGSYRDIWLTGPARHVYSGTIRPAGLY